MSFAISGFGARQYQATPQVFQALSLGGASPAPAQQPFGSPNQDLVPVAPTQGHPLSLSLQAAPVAAAIEAIAQGPVAQQASAVATPALHGAGALSTAFTGARNSEVLLASGPPGTLSGAYGGIPPQGIVAFDVRTPILSAAQLIPNTSVSSAASAASPSSQQTANTTHASTVAKIVHMVKNLAVAAVYPQPLFSFTA